MANEPTPTKQSTAPTAPTHRHRWLINNEERVRGFAMPPVYSEQAKASTPDANVFTIAPGANLIDAKRWEQLKAKDPADKKIGDEPVPGAGEIHRLLTTKIPRAAHRNRMPEAAGAFYLVEGPHVANKNAPLDGIDEAAAIGVVEELRDLAMVRACLKIEKRSAVNEALHRADEMLTKGMQSTVAA